MTDIKKFKRGSRTYTRVGRFKEIRVDSDNPSTEKIGQGRTREERGETSAQEAPSKQVQIDIDARTELGVYSNTAIVHRSAEEVVLDFSFIAPNSPRGRILSRVVLSPQHARALANLLKQASEDEK